MKIRRSLFAMLITLTVLSATGQQPSSDPRFLFVAHRGASYLAPENTLASIRLAWELGADAAECDVMLTADRQVILFHDSNTRRLTGESHVIAETEWATLQELRISPPETNLPEFTGEKIPLLEEVLATIPEGRMLVIEIKTGPEIMPYLAEVIDAHWKSGAISFIAFDFETISAAKQRYPEVPCYYLSMLRPDLKRHFDDVVQAGLEGVDLRFGMINRPLMKKCGEAGLDVWCWTVDDPETAWRMRALGVTAVTTNRPAWLKENL